MAKHKRILKSAIYKSLFELGRVPTFFECVSLSEIYFRKNEISRKRLNVKFHNHTIFNYWSSKSKYRYQLINYNLKI